MAEHVVEMRYQMDVFSGYKLVGGAWFEVQTHTQCCPKCTPDCGGACCDRKGGFQCMVSDDTGGGGGGGSGWDKPTCAKEGGPNSFSCIDQACSPPSPSPSALLRKSSAVLLRAYSTDCTEAATL